MPTLSVEPTCEPKAGALFQVNPASVQLSSATVKALAVDGAPLGRALQYSFKVAAFMVIAGNC